MLWWFNTCSLICYIAVFAFYALTHKSTCIHALVVEYLLTDLFHCSVWF